MEMKKITKRIIIYKNQKIKNEIKTKNEDRNQNGYSPNNINNQLYEIFLQKTLEEKISQIA